MTVMTLDDVLENQSEEVKDIFHQLRKILIDISPKLDEAFLGGAKVRMSSYSINEKMVSVLGPAKDHCKLYLHHTDKVDTGILKLEGKGKHAKTVKVRNTSPELLKEIENVLTEIARITSNL